MVYLFKYSIFVPVLATLIINNKKAYKVEMPSGLVSNFYAEEVGVF